MPDASAYLLLKTDDGYGEIHPLGADARYTLGRAPTSRIVLKDELCSREHAEVFCQEGQWYLRDNGSLNGTRLNGQLISQEMALAPQDEIRIGRVKLIFVEALDQLPGIPRRPSKRDEAVAIRKRATETRFLQPIGEAPDTVVPLAPPGRPIERDLSLLYRLALDMGTATTLDSLVKVVLHGLLEAIPAEVGAILAVQDSRDLELLAYHHRDPAARTYHKVSQFVSTEVLASREAVLAEDVASHADLRNRDSLAELRATSLICAPVVHADQVLALIHLYSTATAQPLTNDDLDFSVAVAKQMSLAVHQLRRQDRLSAENRSLRDQLRVESELVGKTKSIKDIVSQIGRVAGTNATVLIRGESGVGKELVARAIHYSSPRKDGPFVTLNCAALTETLLESELFGHEKGSFTGATEKMIGKFESADKGSIFLDEIGEMNVGTQAKLLRVLEGHPFERVGGNVPIKADVRVVAATNQPLEHAVQSGRFRRDLFFRLQVVEVRVPPLRDRPDDVPILVEHFLKRFARETGRKIRGFTPTAMDKLQKHNWPGNVRELRNVIERAVALGYGPTLDADDIWLSSLDLDSGPAARAGYQEMSLEDLEKEHILATLKHTDWNKSQAAAILGIERSTLDRKIKLYELQK